MSRDELKAQIEAELRATFCAGVAQNAALRAENERLTAALAETRRDLADIVSNDTGQAERANQAEAERDALKADARLGATVRGMRERIDRWLVADGTNNCIEIISDIADAIAAPASVPKEQP